MTELQIETLSGGWASIASGTIDGLKREADAIFEGMGYCVRVKMGGGILYQRLDVEEHQASMREGKGDESVSSAV